MRAEAHLRLLTMAGMQKGSAAGDYSPIPDFTERSA